MEISAGVRKQDMLLTGSILGPRGQIVPEGAETELLVSLTQFETPKSVFGVLASLQRK